MQFPTGGHLGRFQLFAVTNSVSAISTVEKATCNAGAEFLQGWSPEMKLPVVGAPHFQLG